MTLGTAFVWAAAWSFTWSALDLALSAWILTQELPPSVMTRKHEGGHGRALTLSFLVRLAAFVVLISLVLASLLVLFEVTQPFAFFALLTSYVFVYNAVQNPQVFDEYAWARSAVRWCARHLGPGAAVAIGLAMLLLLNMELFAGAAPWSMPRAVVAAVVDAVLIFYMARVQSHAVPVRRRPKPYSPADERLNLILIGVDSLRRDVLESYRAAHPGGRLARLLGESAWFENVVAPIGRTFPALVSIFTAKNPIDHGVRDALSSAILEGDAILRGSPTWRLRREHGYQTHVAIDDAKFAYFHGGETFDVNRAPRPGIGTHLLPILFRNKIFFALFNNRLGFALFPELANNAAFFFAYKLGYFTDQARSDLERLAGGGKPFFATFHSCGLHWPGSACYPYYPRDGHPPKDSLAFGYMSGWMRAVDAPLRTPDKTRVPYNRRLYEHGAAMVIERFVEPLLGDLETAGLLERSMVVLYSDHAEALGSDAPLPIRKVPTHGTSLLWDDDSVEQTVLAIRLPKSHRDRLPAERRCDYAGTIDILPTFLDITGYARGEGEGRSLTGLAPTRPYVSETALWLREAFPDQLVSKVWKPSMLYRVEPRTGEVYLAVEAGRQLVSTKQRAIYKDGHRLTVYPTLHGYRIRVEPMSATAEIYFDDDTLLRGLLARFENDVRAGLFPRFTGRDVGTGCLDWIDPHAAPLSSLLRLQRAVELVHRYHHVDLALDELVVLASEKKEEPALRISAFDHLLTLIDLTSRRDESVHALLKGYELPRLVEYIDGFERGRLLRLRRQVLNRFAGVAQPPPPARFDVKPSRLEAYVVDAYAHLQAMVWRGEGTTETARALRRAIMSHPHVALVELRLALLEATERLAFDVSATELTIDDLRGIARFVKWHRDRGLVHEPGEALSRGLQIALHHQRTDLVLELARDALAQPLLPLRVTLTQLFPALDAIADARQLDGALRFKLLLAGTGTAPDVALDAVRRRERELFAAIEAAA